MNIRQSDWITESRIEKHERGHSAVLSNQYWFTDKPKLLDPTFSAKNTRTRSRIILDSLRRAALAKGQFADQYDALANRLSDCGDIRCGSSACLNCLRAFQQAKATAHRVLISEVATLQPKQLVYLVTIVPREQYYPKNTFHEFDAATFTRLLGEPLHSFPVPFVGSVDFSVELSDNGKYIQPHFHLIIHSRDPDELRKRLKWYFAIGEKYEYPVDVEEMRDLEVVPYIHKVIKINSLLRSSRRSLPELLLTLDRIKPLDLLVMHGVVLGAQDGGMTFEITS